MMDKEPELQHDERIVPIDDGETTRQIIVSANPLQALRGHGRGERLVEKLLVARAEERQRELLKQHL